MPMHERKDAITAKLRQHDQEHVLQFWPKLSHGERRGLLDQLEAIDFDELDRLIEQLVLNKPPPPSVENISPAPCVPLPRNDEEKQTFRQMWSDGANFIESGKVAALVVAGGAGTRLGFDGPKGAFPISPIANKPLFQLFAEYLRAVGRDHGVAIPWYIMTSEANHEETVKYFKQHDYFGLAASDVHFFTQGTMPAVDMSGKLLMESKSSLALSPDGHGGTLTALRKSGALKRMQTDGIELISYFQVDNPLVSCVDPAFIGYHLAAEAQMSSKMVVKLDAMERVGNFCRQDDGRIAVIEYTDLPDPLALLTDDDGRLRFSAGSIAIHLIQVDFVDRLTSGGELSLPFHRAEKKVPCLDANEEFHEPSEPNGVKFEQFIFDALPLAENVVTLETRRTSEFSPVKNASGSDSPESARHDMIERAARWLVGAGVKIPRDGNGDCEATIEISPLFAWHSGNMIDRIAPDMKIRPGEPAYLGS